MRRVIRDTMRLCFYHSPTTMTYELAALCTGVRALANILEAFLGYDRAVYVPGVIKSRVTNICVLLGPYVCMEHMRSFFSFEFQQ